MKKEGYLNFVVDKKNNKIRVERDFEAPLNQVWTAWTRPEILDQWWAPKPWKAQTKSMDFSEGGTWLYAMAGPEGEMHWSKAEFITIEPLKSFSGQDAFSDENGNIDQNLPVTEWENKFTDNGNTTRVTVDLTFKKPADLEKLLEMGFKEGFTAGLENLDEYLNAQANK